MFDPGPCMYMEKIAVGPEAADAIDIRDTPAANLARIAVAKRREVQDLTVVILDRPRHDDLVAQVRATGARIKMITAGDVAGARAVNARLLDSFAFETGDDAPNPIPTKAMMRHLGFRVGQERLPMGPAPTFVEERAPKVWADLQARRGH